ncbi:helix-turn-helix protein [mine drainage metagenome]|uniref:Helix-turn-helix protein n=1 Tax=mine drainage metagenome TaxID=410659 RepID=A0A1J5PN30_9ZZZZ
MTHNIIESQAQRVRITTAVKSAVLVRALRNAFAMSQSYLAELSGSSRPTLNRIETMDKRSPRSDTVDDVLQVFRDMGAEISIGDEEVAIRFTREALAFVAKELAMSATQRDTVRANRLSSTSESGIIDPDNPEVGS